MTTTTTTNTAATLTVRARAFAGQGVRTHEVTVHADGTIRVWDAVAGHYTTCHSLSRQTQARIRKQA